MLRVMQFWALATLQIFNSLVFDTHISKTIRVTAFVRNNNSVLAFER